MAAEHLKSAVYALYHSTNESERGEANKWLMAFAGTAEAWQASRSLLLEHEEDVQYFGANLLFLKVRSEWHGMSHDAKASVYAGVHQLIRQLGWGAEGGLWHRISPGVKRLCLVLATAALRSSAAEAFVREALAMAAEPGGAPVAIELLAALPQESVERAGGAADATPAAGAVALGRSPSPNNVGEKPELRPLLPQVLAVLQHVIDRGVPPDLRNEQLGACLRCLHHWAALHSGCSILTLAEAYPSLTNHTLQALASSVPSLHSSAADSLVEIFSDCNTQLLLGGDKPVGVAHLVADRFVGLAGEINFAQATSSGSEVDERVYHFCRALTAFAERAADIVATTDGRLLPLVQLMVHCLHSELRVVDLTSEFWCRIQDTPLAKRHEQLRQPLYVELLRLYLQKCTLPSDFTTWDESDIDEEDFHRFREQTAKEILGVCQQLLHTDFVAALRSTVSTGMWQQLELTCFVLRALHIEVKATLAQDADGAELAPSLLQAHKAAVTSLLSDLITPIAEGHIGTHPAPLLLSAVRLVGSYGKWLQTVRPALVQGCVRFVLAALASPSVAEAASESFRSLCVHARRRLADLPTVRALLEACQPSLRDPAMAIEMRITLTEGLARLVASLTKEEEAKQALDHLISTPCAVLQQCIQQMTPGAPPSAETASVVAAQLQLVASSIKFCDDFPAAKHPLLPVLQGVWPLLQTAAGMCRSQSEVVSALCTLYCNAMTTLKTLLAPLLPQLLMQVGEAFASTTVIGCLSCVTLAMQIFGREQEEGEVYHALASIMSGFIETTCAWISSAQDAESQPELLTAFWEMCHRCLVFQPGLLLQLPCASLLFETAIRCVCHQEFQHTRAVLTFLCLFLSGTESAGPFRETTLGCLQANGAWLLQQCLSGLASASPDNLVDHQVELMRVLLESCPGAGQSWLLKTISEPSFHCGSIDPKGPTMQQFARLILQQPALSTAEFQCVVSDFSAICRGKLAADALSRYEKPT